MRNRPTAILVSTMLVLVAPAPGAATAPLFPDPVFESGEEPFDIKRGDFNNDGHDDLVIPSWDSNHLKLLLGRGDGTFENRTLDHGRAAGVAVGDFDEDGNLDLVTTHGWSEVKYRAGNGDGTFATPIDVPAGPFGAFDVEAADLDNDGHLDLVVGFVFEFGVDAIAVVPGAGDGSFGPPLVIEGTHRGRSVATGDFDGDGKLDLASADFEGARVFIGNGDGTFVHDPAVHRLGVGQWAASVAITDLNGDDRADLVVTAMRYKEVHVLFGNGDGTFSRGGALALSGRPFGLAIDDLDEDGESDLIVGLDRDHAISLFFGIGGGGFDPETLVASPMQVAGAVVVGDYDEDGRRDLALASRYLYQAGVLLGHGDGTFPDRGRQDVATSDRPSAVAVGDFDEDGHPDLAVAVPGTNQVTLQVGVGDGTVSEGTSEDVGTDPSSIAATDLDGDLHTDLVIANLGSADVSILLGTGDGSFAPELRIPVDPSPESVAVGLLDDDAIADLVVSHSTPTDHLRVLFGNGDGSFSVGPPLAAGSDPFLVRVADLNRDGLADLIVANRGTNDVSMLLGAGDGEFDPEVRIATATTLESITVADVDRDGNEDLLVVDRVPAAVSILPGGGDGTFGAPIPMPREVFAAAVAVGDVDGDRKSDLVTASWSRSTVSVQRGLGGFAFAEAEYFATGGWGVDVHLVDLDLDDRQDLVVTTFFDLVSILPNLGPAMVVFRGDKVTLEWPEISGAMAYNVYRGLLSALVDSNHDGLPDLGYGTCRSFADDDPTDNRFVDEGVPPSGEGFFYLRSVVDFEGERDLGSTSEGLPRLPTDSCN